MSIKKYHIGLTQWGYKEWKSNFFRDDVKPDEFLTQYASVFNSVEGNTTFYNVPAPKTIEKWGAQVPADFKFCFKFPRTITHEKQLRHVTEEAITFLDLFSPIRTKLGPFHVQLPPQFSFEQMKDLEILIESLPPHLSFAVEVRHTDFFDKGKKERHFNDFLKSYGVNRVVFDTRKLHELQIGESSVKKAQSRKPKLPVRFDATGANPFVRFVGANDVLNNQAHLKEWAIITANWIRESRHPYIFIHAPETLHAPELARYFHKELAKLIEISPMPEWPSEKKARQLGLF